LRFSGTTGTWSGTWGGKNLARRDKQWFAKRSPPEQYCGILHYILLAYKVLGEISVVN
jgi:hypothetical protein